MTIRSLLPAALLTAAAAAALLSVREPASAAGDEAYSLAADALRRGEMSAAFDHLLPLTHTADRAAERTRLILGLVAHAGGRVERARDLLAETPDGTGYLEDWRLLVLADCHDRLENYQAARGALAELLRSRPESPLRVQALLRAAAVARRQGDPAGALRILDLTRELAPAGDDAAELELQAWGAAEELGDKERQREAAGRLLVHFPIEASRLQVIEIFRAPDGGLDWSAILPPDDLARRARNLLAAEVHEGALVALDAVPAERRDLGWRLLQAEALILDRRGTEALELLAEPGAGNNARGAEVDWLRARAALEAAARRRGRPDPGRAKREALRGEAVQSLRLAAGQDADPALRVRALRLLFTELVRDEEEEHEEEALATLETLRALRPDDLTGARWLFRRGWRVFDDGNPSSALDLWSRLPEVYPESRYSRSALYWSGRAHEALGNDQRAREILARVAAVDTTDFYRKYALRWLAASGEGQPDPDGTALPAAADWPRDPRLDRARLLTDAGLDTLAMIELRAVRHLAEPRAADALDAIILGRQGRRRESLLPLWRVFPQLGEPAQGGVPEGARRLYYPLDFREEVVRHSRRSELQPHLVFAMIRQESGFDATARSSAGALGLMQLMPATGRELARRLGLRYSTGLLTDPDFSVRLGTAYFRQVLDMFAGNEDLALAGYNGGPYRIKRLWRQAGPGAEIDRFLEGLGIPETTRYVQRVVLFADSYRQLYPDLD